MKINPEAAMQCGLFNGMNSEEIDRLLDCLDARQKSFKAGEIILIAGEPSAKIGVVLSGRAQIIREDYDGRRAIVAALNTGDLFGEAFACAAGAPKTLPVTVMSAAESVVLLLDYRRMVSTCPARCGRHARLIENLLAVLADKLLFLSRRLGHLSRRSTRDKLLSFLTEMAETCGGPEFTIPFNRQDLADYLCVERSAMSSVLSKLREEGIVRYRKNHFILNLQHR